MLKLSAHRDGTKPEIVQDTGTGGSWPISSDRVVWAMGAWELLAVLDGAERTAFRDLAYTAIVNTAEHDRLVGGHGFTLFSKSASVPCPGSACAPPEPPPAPGPNRPITPLLRMTSASTLAGW